MDANTNMMNNQCYFIRRLLARTEPYIKLPISGNRLDSSLTVHNQSDLKDTLTTDSRNGKIGESKDEARGVCVWAKKNDQGTGNRM